MVTPFKENKRSERPWVHQPKARKRLLSVKPDAFGSRGYRAGILPATQLVVPGWTAVAIAATVAVATIAATRGGITLARFVDGQTATIELEAFKLRDRVANPLFICHRDKAEAARTPRLSVIDQFDLLDVSGLGEKLRDVLFGGIKGKVSYV